MIPICWHIVYPMNPLAVVHAGFHVAFRHQNPAPIRSVVHEADLEREQELTRLREPPPRLGEVDLHLHAIVVAGSLYDNGALSDVHESKYWYALRFGFDYGFAVLTAS